MVLGLLVVQNSVYTLLRRYYSMTSSSGQDIVSFPVILMVTEVVKFLVSAGLVELPDDLARAEQSWLQSRWVAVRRALWSSMPMAVPALTYAIMNMMSYKALELIDATVFAMVAQLKIVSTALFSWPVLGRKQSPAQWRAITVLTLAVTIITYQRGAKRQNGVQTEVSLSFMLGVGLTVIEISLSGWINTYFERYLKDGCFSVWGRNLQLGFWSVLVYICVQLSPSTSALSAARSGSAPTVTFASILEQFSSGWVALMRPVPFMLIILGGGGGLLVAFAIKHADAVMKSMATAFSLVIVVLGEVAFLGAGLDPVICLASAVALLGLQIYQDAPKLQPQSLPSLKERAETDGDVTPNAVTPKAVIEGSPSATLRQLAKMVDVFEEEVATELDTLVRHEESSPEPSTIGRV